MQSYIASFLPNLEKYITTRIKQAERKGLIPKNMYAPSGISDEIFIELMQDANLHSADERQIKIRAFTLANKKLKEIIQKERKQQKIPLGEILDNELRLMDESFTTDGDGDLMPIEELDDISYHLEDYQPQLFLVSDDTKREIYEALGIAEEVSPEEAALPAERLLQWLPEETFNIFSLHIYGKLSSEEIAEILSVNADGVQKILLSIKKGYRRFERLGK